MKTICYKIVFALLLVPILGFAGNEWSGRHTKQKKISKSYTVSPDALLKIENSYGNIDISTWNENRIEIEVIIKTNGNDEEKVIERLREIDVDFSGSSSRVSAITRFEKQDRSWWNNLFGSSSNVNMEINYRVKAPVTNNVELSNDYGSIALDRLEGNATIACDYGKLLIGDLLGNRNLLVFDYTRNSQIDFIKRGKIVADYSQFTVGEAGTLEVVADYTDSNIKKVENLNFTADYGSISVDKVRNLVGEGDYLGTKLGLVYGTVELDLDYGSARIEKIMKSVQKVEISSDYTGIKIGYDDGSPFRFNIKTSYGSVRGIDGSGFELNKRHQDSSDDYLEGYYRSNSGGLITIDASYANITFTN